MNCPDCGGMMWDNRQTKKNPKQPDYKCKNKSCDKAIWLKAKGDQSEPTHANGHGVPSPGAAHPLGRLYFEALKIAHASLKEVMGDKMTATDVVAAAATIFIGANQTGNPPYAPKKVKAAPPPPPPDRDEYEGAEPDFDDGLPF